MNWLPKMFAFVAVKDMINIPLIFQLLILEIAIDGLRLAALNTPSMLSTPAQRDRRSCDGRIFRKVRLV